MKTYIYENGPFMVNSYLVLTDDEKGGFILDPGSDIDPLIQEIKNRGITIDAVVATHSHIDHIAGVNLCKNAFNAPFYINDQELEMMDAISVQSRMFGVADPGKIECEHNLPADGEIQIGGLKIKLLHTPGHSPGSISLLIDDTIFSGDALFQMSIGRTDLPGGDYNTLINAINEKLMILPDETRVLSGHGPETSIGFEKKMNPFLK